jgi:hypothetical protein
MESRPNLNPLLKWLWDLITFYSSESIITPTTYPERVAGVKSTLASDTSGLVNSVLDFAINTALVEYNIETENEQLKELVSDWFDQINSAFIGKIPIGIQGLAKEYFRERWKGSSFLVLRSQWADTKIGDTSFNLPTKMWFVDGQNIIVDGDEKVRMIGEENYYIKISDSEKKAIPVDEKELIFVQKPFDSWSSLYANPFLIQRGLWRNLQIFELLTKKGEKFISKALEYMLVFKHGTEALALNGNPGFTYSEDDLKTAKDDLKKVVNDNANSPGIPVYSTNFDTQFEHLVPDYSTVMKTEIFTELERRLLGGLGLIDIITGTSSTRRESILNPKPFIKEVEAGITEYAQLLENVLFVIADRNKANHPKYFSEKIELHYSPIKEFITDNIRDHLRSCYDRGVLSKETYTEVMGVDLDIEVTRRERETDKKLEVKMYPPIIDNKEGTGIDLQKDSTNIPKLKTITPPLPAPKFPATKPKSDNIPVSKKGPEAKNYKGEFGEELSQDDAVFFSGLTPEDLEEGKIVERKDGWYVISEKTGKNLGGPYKTKQEAEKRLRQVEWFKHKGTEEIEKEEA